MRVGKITFGKPNVEDLEDREDVKGLTKALRYNKDWEVRWGAALALGRIKDEGAAQPLVHALEDKEKGVRMAAMRALTNIGRADAELVAHFLSDDYEFVRCEAAWSLGRVGDTRAIEPLAHALSDENIFVRGRAAWALGEIGDAKAIEPLTQALNDTKEYVREEARKSLDKIRTKEATRYQQ